MVAIKIAPIAVPRTSLQPDFRNSAPVWSNLTIFRPESGGFPGFGSPEPCVVPTYPLDRTGKAPDASAMFVRCKRRFKDGKEHRYWSVVENVRVRGGRVVQRHVLYLGEINDSQRAAWCQAGP